jgi:hypothetical protein
LGCWTRRATGLAIAGTAGLLLLGCLSAVVPGFINPLISTASERDLLSAVRASLASALPAVLAAAAVLPLLGGDPWGNGAYRFLRLDTADAEAMLAAHQEIARLAQQHPRVPHLVEAERVSRTAIWEAAAPSRHADQHALGTVARQQHLLLGAARAAVDADQDVQAATAELPADTENPAEVLVTFAPDAVEDLIHTLHDCAVAARSTAKDVRAANRRTSR